MIEKKDLKENKEKEIQQKEKEFSELNERYSAYLEKAKIVNYLSLSSLILLVNSMKGFHFEVIKSLDPRDNPTNNSEIHSLKAKVADKEKIIKQLSVYFILGLI